MSQVKKQLSMNRRPHNGPGEAMQPTRHYITFHLLRCQSNSMPVACSETRNEKARVRGKRGLSAGRRGAGREGGVAGEPADVGRAPEPVFRPDLIRSDEPMRARIDMSSPGTFSAFSTQCPTASRSARPPGRRARKLAQRVQSMIAPIRICNYF